MTNSLFGKLFLKAGSIMNNLNWKKDVIVNK